MEHSTPCRPYRLTPIAASRNIVGELGITTDSFDYTPFAEHGGIGKATQVFGDRLGPLMDELTEALAA